MTNTTGSESYERAVKTLRDALGRCGDSLVHRRGSPQPFAASARAASRDALPHVADDEQRKALELMRRTESKAELVKWSVEEA